MKRLSETDNPQKLRTELISLLSAADDSTEAAKQIADDLFALDLTVYSGDFSLESLIYNSFAQSCLDESVSLHPEQLQILKEISEHEALIISAPTSFGKTFSVFEYIAREKPDNIVLIVPTLALVDEYIKKIIKKYSFSFQDYKVYTQLEVDGQYDFDAKNIFILTHDRVVQEDLYQSILKIDLLVIDEVYKLETDTTDDRVLVLNMAYYHLAKKASKYILLAPFIKSIENIELLEKRPHFYNTEYSPVVNNVEVIKLINPNDRYAQCQKLLTELNEEDKTLIYFPTVRGVYKYVNDFISKEPVLNEPDDEIISFISWAKEEIHEDWSVVKALEHGYAIHNGQIPLGIRLYQLSLYEHNPNFNKLLCTSTLLEGVNTCAKNIIITSPSRRSETEAPFTAFDFYNLVGRTGRLNQHFIGNAFYLKAPNDPIYEKIDAIRSIKFELTDFSKDIDIQTGNAEDHPDYVEFLRKLGISHDDYIKNIGSHFRFDTVKSLYNRYKTLFSELISEIQRLLKDEKSGRLQLIKILYAVCEDREDSFQANLINSLINRNRPKIHEVVDGAMRFFSSRGIDAIISSIIKLKTSYIEHSFYAKLLIIRYFMELDRLPQSFINVLNNRVMEAIEHLYFSSSKQKKMLLDIGIYERDIDHIISVIGSDFTDVFEMKKRLKESAVRFRNIGYISHYIIKNL